jgi:hypothetical protein
LGFVGDLITEIVDRYAAAKQGFDAAFWHPLHFQQSGNIIQVFTTPGVIDGTLLNRIVY